jgi:hypothetical protein
MELGSPPSPIFVEINTGSSDFWVYPVDKGWTPQGHNASNSSTSRTDGKNMFKSVDQDGSVSGTVAQDACWLGIDPDHPETLSILSMKCTFGVVDKAKHVSAMNDTDLTRIFEGGTQNLSEEIFSKVDGMLGLGIAYLNDQTPTAFLPWLARTHNSN